MKKILFTLSLMFFQSIFSLNIVAQTINNATDLKNFYIKYLSDESIETLVSKYCTEQLCKEWKEIVIEEGLYDPFTKGLFDDYELMKKTLVVNERAPKEGYRGSTKTYDISFKAHSYEEETNVISHESEFDIPDIVKTKVEEVIKTEKLVINVDKGKISRIIRPEDNYNVPSGIGGFGGQR